MKCKILFLFAFLYFNQANYATSISMVSDDGVVSISLDSINPVISSWGDYIVQVKQSNGETTNVFRVDASCNDLGELKKIAYKNEIIYVLPVYELLVGFDYLFVIQSNPLRCFITKPFNYIEGQYTICDEISLDSSPYYLTIREDGIVKKIDLTIYSSQIKDERIRESHECADSVLVERLLQKVLDIKDLQQYFAVDEVKNRGYLIVLKNDHISRYYDLQKRNEKVVFLSKEEIIYEQISAYIEFKDVIIKSDSAEVTLIYSTQGIKCDAIFKKDKCDWTLVETDIVER